MKIHPTAIIEDGAVLADDVEVGPYALIGNNVRIGAGCIVQAHAVLTSRVTMGEKNLVGYGTVIGAAPQDFAHNESIQSEVRIGSGNTFREYVTIHRGTKEGTATVVGDGNYLMTASHLAHNVQIGNKVVIANNCLLAGYVSVDDGTVLGGGTVFHQFIRIGSYVMVRGGTRFGKDIPPYTTADRDNILAGINIIGLKRNGFSLAARQEIRALYRLIFRNGLNLSQALEIAKEKSWGVEATRFLDFLTSSKRGLCHAHRKSEDAPEDSE
ncbi:MAG: acyl-ACP--UDP-N-acetylglucosamine O-acyltransferase [Chthoniobacterales bacterium]